MTTQASNEFKKEMMDANIDFGSHTFKIALMQSGFVYNRVTHGAYADCSASELSTGSGYTAGGFTLTGVSLTQDDTNNQGKVTWNNAAWTASGGSIVASGAIIYDDSHASDVIVGYIDFNGDQTTLDGGVFTVANIEVDVL